MTTPVFGLCGWSGSGKTTLLVKLIELLSGGRRVDRQTRPSALTLTARARIIATAAGAHQVMVASGQRWALMHELRGADEP